MTDASSRDDKINSSMRMIETSQVLGLLASFTFILTVLASAISFKGFHSSFWTTVILCVGAALFTWALFYAVKMFIKNRKLVQENPWIPEAVSEVWKRDRDQNLNPMSRKSEVDQRINKGVIPKD